MFGEIAAALWAELLKVRRSKVPWVTFVAFTMAGLVGGFFMFVLQDPDRARSLGLLGGRPSSPAERQTGPATSPSSLRSPRSADCSCSA